ncbi:MAG: preprotein translocase subunit SecG [Negativicutes bacterium]|nr:preprotein translocase subunit SecG [Negativicutes bacterium]
MQTFVMIVHLVLCVGLIVAILLQAPKGEGISEAFGGQAAQFLNKQRGFDVILTRCTIVLGFLVAITSLVLAVWRT